MIFQAHYSRTFIGFLIRLFSLGRLNHISIRLGNYVYEATIKGGVIKTLYTKWESDTVVDTREIPLTPDQYSRVRIWLNKQVGKKYDIIGIVSFLFILLPPRKGYFFCSELAICALAKALGDCDDLDNQKVSPDLFWRILKLIK